MICLVFFPPNPMKLSIKLWLMVDDYLWFWGCMICFLVFWWCCFFIFEGCGGFVFDNLKLKFFFWGVVVGFDGCFFEGCGCVGFVGDYGVHGGTRIRMWVAEFKSMCSPVSNTLDFLIVTLPLLLAGPWFFPGVPNRQTPIPFWWTFENFTFHNQSSISG